MDATSCLKAKVAKNVFTLAKFADFSTALLYIHES